MTKKSPLDLNSATKNAPSSILSKRNNYSSSFELNEVKNKGYKKLSYEKLRKKNTNLNSSKRPMPRTPSKSSSLNTSWSSPGNIGSGNQSKLEKMNQFSTQTRTKNKVQIKDSMNLSYLKNVHHVYNPGKTTL